MDEYLTRGNISIRITKIQVKIFRHIYRKNSDNFNAQKTFKSL